MTDRQVLFAYLGGVLWGMALIVGVATTLAAATRDVLRLLNP